MQDIFVLERTGIGPRGNVTGRFTATGVRPHVLERLKVRIGVHLRRQFDLSPKLQELKDAVERMFLFVAFLIFTGAWARAATTSGASRSSRRRNCLAARLRELRVPEARASRPPRDLVRREQRGSLAFLGDFVAWLGVLRRLQLYIDQANLEIPRRRSLRAVRDHRRRRLHCSRLRGLEPADSAHRPRARLRRVFRWSTSRGSAAGGCANSRKCCRTPSTCSTAP